MVVWARRQGVAELRARSEQGEPWWVRPLQEGRTYTLGRVQGEADWAVPWDPYVSRLHAVLHWKAGRLWVRRHPEAQNPIFVHGRAADEFTLAPGERFVIGSTIFELCNSAEETATAEPTPDFAEIVYPIGELQPRGSVEPPARALLQKLPDLLRAATGIDELDHRTLEVLLAGLPHADWAALVRALGEPQRPQVRLLSWLDRSRPSAVPQPSRRLVWSAVRRQRKNIVHLWTSAPETLEAEYTVSAHLDWAICVPLVEAPEPDLALYVAGRLGQQHLTNQQRLSMLQPETQYIDLVARIHAALRRLHHLQWQQSVLAQFFPRPVLALFSHETDLEDVLRPRPVEVTVLFCDLRGSSRFADQWEHDLLGLWHRISDALALMSSCIADFGGVLGDFHGDAAMGFWGWPLPDRQGHEKAARAALAIYRRFQALSQQPGHPLHGFRCGIGIATGQAVAGRLGTPEQFKVTVYGPPVNLAARLETLTKRLGASTLLDRTTALRLRASGCDPWAVTRRLGKVRPAGMERLIELYELLPAEQVRQHAALHGSHPEDLEAAVEQLETRHWTLAAEILGRMKGDPVAQTLHRLLQKLGNRPPDDWDGALPVYD